MTSIARATGIAALTFTLVGCFEESEADAFVSACNEHLDAPEELCDCMGEQAEADLSPAGIEWLSAAIAKNDAKTAALRQDMPWTELVAASMFLVSAPAQCGSDLNVSVDAAASSDS